MEEEEEEAPPPGQGSRRTDSRSHAGRAGADQRSAGWWRAVAGIAARFFRAAFRV
jgi:hypothetical protein